MLITLQEWDKKIFSQTHSLRTLRSWARTGQIYPPPKKVGRKYQVEETARYIGLQKPHETIEDPIVNKILQSVKAA